MEPTLTVPKELLAKAPTTFHVDLTGRQCRVIKWVFSDFLQAAAKMPELPEDLLMACRQIATFAGLHAGATDDGHEKQALSMSVLQAHFIAFALTLQIQARTPHHHTVVATIQDISEGYHRKFGSSEFKQ